jgi:GR25 family glycosyltransferase involved in LPS biosynthesis
MKELGAYIISFKEEAARRKLLKTRFGKIGINPHFIDAVRGSALSEAEKSAFNKRRRQMRHGFMMQDNAIGCALSHHLAWRRIIESGAACGFVFEDDAVPLRDNVLPRMEELVRLAGRLDIVFLTNMREKLERRMVRPCGGSSGLYFLKGNDFGAISYLITAKAAGKLLENPLLCQYEVDFLMHHWWNHDCQTLHMLPPLFGEDGRTSTLDHKNIILWPGEGLGEKLLRRLNRLSDSVLKRVLSPIRYRRARKRLLRP